MADIYIKFNLFIWIVSEYQIMIFFLQLQYYILNKFLNEYQNIIVYAVSQ